MQRSEGHNINFRFVAGAKKGWKPFERLPVVSLDILLSSLLDISQPPSPVFMGHLATLAADAEEKERLTVLSNVSVCAAGFVNHFFRPRSFVFFIKKVYGSLASISLKVQTHWGCLAWSVFARWPLYSYVHRRPWVRQILVTCFANFLWHWFGFFYGQKSMVSYQDSL